MSNLKKIEGGVTTPQGFTAGAVYTAIKKRENKKPDVAVLYSDLPCSCAACFTTNKFCAAPVILDREILKKGKPAPSSSTPATPTPPPASRASKTPAPLSARRKSCSASARTKCSSAPPASSARDFRSTRCFSIREIIPAKLAKENGSEVPTPS